jgi:hypothetical protein
MKARMKRNLFFAVLFWLSPVIMLAAKPEADTLFEPMLCGEVYEMPAGYNGSPYYGIGWMNGDIQLISGETAYGKLLRYNGFTDQLIWLNPKTGVETRLEKNFISGFVLRVPGAAPQPFARINVRLPFPTDTAGIFARVISEGLVSCYRIHRIAVRGYKLEDREGMTYISNDLREQPVYVLILPGAETLIFRKISRRNILKNLSDSRKNTLRELLNQHHLALHSENDLRKLSELLSDPAVHF